MSPYAGLRNIVLIGFLFGFHGLLNRSLLIDNVSEIFIVTARITIVTVLLGIYCGKEFLREINTIGSKTDNVKTSHLAVNIKTEIEKIREQVQNIL